MKRDVESVIEMLNGLVPADIDFRISSSLEYSEETTNKLHQIGIGFNSDLEDYINENIQLAN